MTIDLLPSSDHKGGAVCVFADSAGQVLLWSSSSSETRFREKQTLRTLDVQVLSREDSHLQCIHALILRLSRHGLGNTVNRKVPNTRELFQVSSNSIHFKYLLNLLCVSNGIQTPKHPHRGDILVQYMSNTALRH